MKLAFTTLYFSLFMYANVQTTNFNIRDVVEKNYDKHTIQKDSSGNPLNVSIQVSIRAILDLNELTETIKLDIGVRMFWTDFKIRDKLNKTGNEGSSTVITLNNPAAIHLLWRPNLFFENLIEVQQPAIMKPPSSLKIIPQLGRLEYLNRMIATVDCPMDFHYYPADSQLCKFGIREFSYTQKDLVLRWHRTGVYLFDANSPNFDITVDQLWEYFVNEDEDPDSNTFQVLAFNIKSRRQLSYHLVQTYLPYTFYIMITCLCFILPVRYVEARIAIAMTTLLTLTAMFGTVRESTPTVSYIKAIDIWMVGCIIFVFLTLVQFTFQAWVKAFKEKYDRDVAKKNDELLDNAEIGENTTQEKAQQVSESKKISSIPKKMRISRKVIVEISTRVAEVTEKYSFAFFIILIYTFSAVYWSWLLVSSNYFDFKLNENHTNIRENHIINQFSGIPDPVLSYF